MNPSDSNVYSKEDKIKVRPRRSRIPANYYIPINIQSRWDQSAGGKKSQNNLHSPNFFKLTSLILACIVEARELM